MDQAIVKYQVVIYEGDGETDKVLQIAGVHKCNQEEWKSLHQPAKKDQAKISKLKESRVMLCADRNDSEGRPIDYTIYGPDS